MLSLNAGLEEEEVKKFFNFVRRHTDLKNVRFVLEPKFDGLSVELIYQKGTLKYGATRGNGQVGEDITRNLKTIRAIPMHLRKKDKAPDFLAVRGEVFMPRKQFQELNKKRIEKGEEPFANPRNAAAGIMRHLDPQKVFDKPLDIVFYEILQTDKVSFSSHWEVLEHFPAWGFKTNANNRKATSLKNITGYRKSISEKRDDLAYDIDGIVIKVDSFEARERLGVRQRSPRWAFAWKFQPKEEITRLEDIVVQVGRTGKLTPVALLQPVDVDGVTVSRATLHNANEVEKKDVRTGDDVRIARAGDVIPEVVERIKRPGKKRGLQFKMPEKCPACRADVYVEGAYHLCSGRLKCPPQISGAIIHYASRDAMNINGLGEKTAEALVEKNLVKDIADLYKLKQKDLMQLEGFGEKSAGKLHKAIRKTKSPSLDRFLFALGIRNVGQRAAGIIADSFGSFENLRKAGKNELQEIPGIGPETAGSVKEFFQQEQNRQVLEGLSRSGVEVQKAGRKKSSERLSGKTFVFTGKLSEYTRRQAEQLVKQNGGRAISSVSGEADYLVRGEDPGSKYDEAQERRIKIIGEDEFKKMLFF